MDRVYRGEKTIAHLDEILNESFPGCFKFWKATAPFITESTLKNGVSCCMFTVEGPKFLGKVEIHQLDTYGYMVQLTPGNRKPEKHTYPVESVLDLAFVVDELVRGKYIYQKKYFFSMGRN